MHETAIRVTTFDDIPSVQGVARTTWYATYTGHIPPEDIERFVTGAYAAEWLQRSVDRLGAGFMIAETADGVVGYAMVGTNRDGIAEQFAIYVLPDVQGHGIGKALWDVAVTHATGAGYPAMMVWVLAANTVARRFYERQGAVATGERAFRVGEASIVEAPCELALG